MRKYFCYRDMKFENKITVGQLIEELKKFDESLHVNVGFMGCTDRIIGISLKGLDTRYNTNGVNFLEIR